MSILGRPSRSYARVDHNPDGLSGVGNLPYSSRRSEERVRTYRPNLGDTHLRRGNDEPESSFPISLSHRRRKEAATAAQRAEVDAILDPEYKSTYGDADGSSVAGPSRAHGARTAGGFAATANNDRKAKSVGMSVRSSSSIGSLRSQRSKIAGGGMYVDGSGKRHDKEYDPFSKVSEMNRKSSRRRSAFGSERRKGSDESSTDGSEGGGDRPASAGPRGSFDTNGDKSRQRLDSDAKAAAVRRKSLLSDRGTLDGRHSPSLRSSEDGDRLTARSALMDRKSKSAQGSYVRSPLSPNFSAAPTGSSYATARTLPTTEESQDGDDSPAVPSSNGRLLSPPLPPSATMPMAPRERVEVRRDGSVKVTGFDAPSSPMPQPSATFESAQNASLKVPDSARSANSARSAGSRASSDRDRPRPAERRREDTFPETPAQTKRREERAALARSNNFVRATSNLAIDTQLASGSLRRPLPEIEIVDDDDPRVVLPKEGQGRYTRVQQTQDHVIRGPFSLALNAQGGAGSPSGERRPSSGRSIPFSTGSGPSSILDEAPNGYLPSRWAGGDRLARVTEEERERYRPQEWGGKKGDLAGKPAEWQPDVKENIKRTMKDFSTSARISLFRAKKKLQRKTDI